jgi:hypothetical protein
MTKIPKRLKRLLRKWAGEAHEEELRRALVPLAEAFDRWKRGDIASSELSNLIHKFHQGLPRELFVKYNTNHLEAPVAHAIVSGVLDKDKISPELLEHLVAWIKFYADREAAEDTQENDIPEDDEDSGRKRVGRKRG